MKNLPIALAFCLAILDLPLSSRAGNLQESVYDSIVVAPGSGVPDSYFNDTNGPNPGSASLDALQAFYQSTAPTYTYTNTTDAFQYSGSSGVSTDGTSATGYAEGGTTVANYLGPDAPAGSPAASDNSYIYHSLYVANGYVNIYQPGTYNFSIPNADDAARIYVNGTAVADQNYYGGDLVRSNTGSVTLSPGSYPFEVLHAQGWGGANLNVQVTGPNGANTFSYSSTQQSNLPAIQPGLNEYVYHVGNVPLSTGDHLEDNPTDAHISAVQSFVSTQTPSYSFLNTNDSFNYSSATYQPPTNSLLGADAAGKALTDTASSNDTVFDAKGYIALGATGTYTFNIANSDDAARVYVDGNLIAEQNYPQNLTGPSSESVVLSGGLHTFEFFYYQGFGGAYDSYSVTGPGSVSYYSAVPEPSSVLLLGLGTVGLFVAARRRAAGQAASQESSTLAE